MERISREQISKALGEASKEELESFAKWMNRLILEDDDLCDSESTHQGNR